ncbi:MAG: nucleotidyltransferase family protein [Deltaproteobacteria bacterium]|nr:nucleotidyltransferase family protein [Deltaproteobacteria bacterium]
MVKAIQKLQIDVPKDRLVAFCKKWKIRELSFFGSVVRDDFGPDSDIDVLARFAPNHGWSLFDHVDAEDELEQILGRPVDLVSRRAIENSRNELRKKLILGEAQVYYTDEEAA